MESEIPQKHYFLWWGAAIASTLLFMHSIWVGGPTWDEHFHFQGTEAQLTFARNVLQHAGSQNFQSIPRDWSFYGLGTLLPAYALSYIVDPLLFGRPHTFHQSFSFFAHLIAFCSYLAASWFVGRLVYLGTRKEEVATYAAVGILLMPPWVGFGLFDYKDMPVAAGLIASVYYAASYFEFAERRDLVGFFVALLFLGSQKLAALPLALPACAAVAIATIKYPTRSRIAALAVLAVAFLVFLYLITPPAWVEPWRFVSTNLAHMSQTPWIGCTLTAGECIGLRPVEKPDLYSPLRYLGLWYAVKIPIGFLVMAALAIMFYLHRSGDALRHLMAASIVWPIVAIVWNQSTLFDGIRHTLFLIPLLVVFVFINIPTTFWHRWRHWLVAYGIFLCIESFSMHPYSYVWFNEVARFVANEENFETDYWGYSLAEAANRARELNVPADYVIGNPPQLVAPYFDPSRFAADVANLPSGASYLFISYTKTHTVPPQHCQVLTRVTRSQLLSPLRLELAFVARCVKP